MEEIISTDKPQVLVDIDNLLTKISAQNEKAINYIKEEKYKDAEEIYKQSIKEMEAYKPSGDFSVQTDERYKKKGFEILTMMKRLYSNLVLCQDNLGEIEEATQNSLYILNNFDPYHDKSYIRILKWLINSGNVEKAKEIADEIKLKFYGDKLIPFKKIFDLLDYKLKTNNAPKEKEEEKVTSIEKEEGSKYKKYLIITGVVSLLGICFSLLRHYYKSKVRI